LLIVELARAYNLLKKGLTVKEVEEKLGNEKVQMYNYWTRGLKEKEKKGGNIYLLKDRVRWTIFQVFIAGL
jgi:hypothetical protein